MHLRIASWSVHHPDQLPGRTLGRSCEPQLPATRVLPFSCSQSFDVRADLGALQALRNPPMAAVLSHLQHTALTQPWSIRVAAVQSIAKVRLPPLGSRGAVRILLLLLLHSRSVSWCGAVPTAQQLCVMMRCCAHCADCCQVRGAISAASLHCAAWSGGDRCEDQPRCSRSVHVCWLTYRCSLLRRSVLSLLQHLRLLHFHFWRAL